MSKERAIVASGCLPMEASAQYREFAEKCDRLVEETKEPRHKLMLQEMAQAWRNLASEEERKKAP
jgi:uncharacterized protein (DUF1697 family)